LRLLDERIEAAKIVDLAQQNQHEVHFGANVTLYKEEEHCKGSIE
jgi:transcription elongation GreA/GreB family factor